MKYVYYHHPVSEDYSLQFVGETAETVTNYLAKNEYEDAKLIAYPYEPPVYTAYIREVESRAVSDVEYDEEWLRSETASLSSLGAVVVFRLVELLSAAVESEDSEEFLLYKRLQPRTVDEALSHVEWGGLLPAVAGELMSNLILRHALPNANHRTAIAMTQFCIECVDGTFEMPRTHVDDEHWEAWVNPYISESKRLLTVWRNHHRFQHLARLGVETVLRKGGIEIELAAYKLDLPTAEAKRRFAKQHELHCREFVTAVLAKSGREELASVGGPTRGEFEDYLRAGVHAHDFEDLFR